MSSKVEVTVKEFVRESIFCPEAIKARPRIIFRSRT